MHLFVKRFQARPPRSFDRKCENEDVRKMDVVAQTRAGEFRFLIMHIIRTCNFRFFFKGYELRLEIQFIPRSKHIRFLFYKPVS